MEKQTLSLKTYNTAYQQAPALPALTPPADALPTADPYPYGWRQVLDSDADGKAIYRRQALTYADILNPQVGDKMPQNDLHSNINEDLSGIFKRRYEDDRYTAVYIDLKFLWGIPGLEEPAPDVAIVPNVKNKAAHPTSFKVKKEGTRPSLVIEIISPNYPGDDTDKVRIYEQAGIMEYIIIKPTIRKELVTYKVWGYRLVQGKYQPIKPNAAGEILSQTTNVYFTIITENGEERLQLLDAITRQPLLNNKETEQARRRAERAQLFAEAKAKKEAEARLAAEAKAQALEDRLKDMQAKMEQMQQMQSNKTKKI